MNQSQQNLARLAFLCRDEKKAFTACCALAKKLNLKAPKRNAPPFDEASTRLQNFVRRIHADDLQNAVVKFGATAVHNHVNCASILEIAVRKFAEQAIQKAGGK